MSDLNSIKHALEARFAPQGMHFVEFHVSDRDLDAGAEAYTGGTKPYGLVIHAPEYAHDVLIDLCAEDVAQRTLSAARMAPPLRYFPVDIKWRVQARYVPVAGADSLPIIGVLGTETHMAHPGDLRFTIDGKKYSLMVIREPEDHTNDLFVMFTDSTNRKESYPATRYAWVSPPDSLGRTVIDFNKAFNPPCAFTKFATCPFPPKGNHVPWYVTAGEWNPHYEEGAAKAPK